MSGQLNLGREAMFGNERLGPLEQVGIAGIVARARVEDERR